MSESLEQTIKRISNADKAFFDEAFKGVEIPAKLRKLSERLCGSYGIRGICDPLYIANVIAVELGLGDGQSNFTGGQQ